MVLKMLLFIFSHQVYRFQYETMITERQAKVQILLLLPENN